MDGYKKLLYTKVLAYHSSMNRFIAHKRVQIMIEKQPTQLSNPYIWLQSLIWGS